MALLTRLTKKDQPFSWGIETNNVFQSLKAYFTTTPLLIHQDPSKPFVLEMDTYDFVVGVIFSQLGEYNLFHLVNFHFRKFFFTKINYNIHDKELLTIMDAFEE